MAEETKNIVESFKLIIQDLVAPEIRVIKSEIQSLHKELGFVRDEFKSETRRIFDKIDSSEKILEGKIDNLSFRFEEAVKMRERIAALENRVRTSPERELER